MVKRKKVIKKNSEQDCPEKRIKDKHGEVAIARGRLAGALKGLLNRNADDSDEQDSSCVLSQSLTSNNKLSRDSSPAQWKKENAKMYETEDHQSYLMKLFDRSVNLAQFDINTPLYPICRAWIQNQPISCRKFKDGLVEIKHENGEVDSQLYELHERNVNVIQEDGDVYRLPQPRRLPDGFKTLRIPSPVPRQIEKINLNPEPDQAPSKEELLQFHLRNWITVRKCWREASQKNEERFADSRVILSTMFERAQVQFHVP